MSENHVVIVGAGAAGLSVAETLRRQGFAGRITLVGEEDAPPYDRPPLSKQYLAGEWDAERLWLRPPTAIESLQLDRRFGVAAVAADAQARTVTLSDGESLQYDALAITAGVHARTLPGTDHIAGLHTLRTMADVDGLRNEIRAGRELLIVGAGFLGSEAAAVARQAGAEVTLVSDLQAPLADVVGAEVGEMLMDYHRAHGVRVETGARVEQVLQSDGRTTGVRLGDGRTLAADAVLLAIGSVPATAWLEGSGIPVNTAAPGGVLCDENCQATAGVWAAGDIASWSHPVFGERIRIEHRTNAGEQGMAVARNILAEFAGEKQKPFAPVPYIWSDQYDLKIQIYGLPRLRDEVVISAGAAENRQLLALYGNNKKVCGALSVNMIREIREARKLVANHAPMPKVEVTTS